MNCKAEGKMGSPNVYYKRALQCFSHALAYDSDFKLARKLEKETSEEILEEFILNKKKEIPEKEFYFLAGRAEEFVFNEADQDGCEGMNASCGGLSIFEDFIGIET
jgi:hypothetical protein